LWVIVSRLTPFLCLDRMWEWRIDRAMHSMATAVYTPRTETLSMGALAFEGRTLFGKISYSLLWGL